MVQGPQRPVGGEAEPGEGGGAVRVGLQHHMTVGHRPLVPLADGLGVGDDEQPVDPGGDLAGGLARGLLQDQIDQAGGHLSRDHHQPFTDHPGPGKVDPPLRQGSRHLRETQVEVMCETQMPVGRPAGAGQGGLDLLGGELVDTLPSQPFFGFRHRPHVGVELGLHMGDWPARAFINTTSP